MESRQLYERAVAAARAAGTLQWEDGARMRFVALESGGWRLGGWVVGRVVGWLRLGGRAGLWVGAQWNGMSRAEAEPTPWSLSRSTDSRCSFQCSSAHFGCHVGFGSIKLLTLSSPISCVSGLPLLLLVLSPPAPNCRNQQPARPHTHTHTNTRSRPCPLVLLYPTQATRL